MSCTHEPLCPICHKLETVDHAFCGCQFHALIFDALDQSWAPVTRGNACHSVRTLAVALTLATTPGIMLWTAKVAHWSLRCATCQNAAVPTFEAFIKAWLTFVEKVTAWQGLSPLADAFLVFRNTLLTLQTTGSLPACQIVLTRPELSSPEKERKHRKIARKQELADQARTTLHWLEHQGFAVAWTDGSPKWQTKSGWVGGYGATVAE